MDGQSKKIPLMGPAGLYHAEPTEAPGLIGMGFKPATPEDIEFSGPLQKTIGGLEVAGRGIIPFFTAAELLAGADPERIRKRREVSIGEDLADVGEFSTMLLGPGIVGKGLGMVGKLAGVPKALEYAAAASKFGTKAGIAETVANAATKGIEGKVGQLATKYALEGAQFGVMDSLDRSLISPEPKDALSVSVDALSAGAMGLLTGAVGGALVGKGKQLWQARFGNKATRVLEQLKADTSGVPPVEPPGAAGPTPPSGPGAGGGGGAAQATSMQDVLKLTKEITEKEMAELPEKQALLDAMAKVKDNKNLVLPTEIHVQSFDNPIVRDKFRAAKEFADADAAALINYDNLIKKSMVEGMDKEVKSLGTNVSADKIKGGNRALELFRKSYLEKRGADAEAFWNKWNKLQMNPVTYYGEVTGALVNSLPEIEKLLVYDGVDGSLKLLPRKSTSALSKEAYEAAKEVVEAINEKGLDVGGLNNVRREIKTRIDWTNMSKDKSNSEITRLRAGLMDIMKSEVQKSDPSINVKKYFENYAINAKDRAEVQRALRGNIFGEGLVDKGVPADEVMVRIFQNVDTVAAAKRLLGPERFKVVLADYLAQKLDEFTDAATRKFSSARMNTFLRQKMPELQVAFADNLEALERIKAMNTIARIVPDAQSIQPSGNIKTAVNLFRKVVQAKNINPLELIGSITEMAANKAEKTEVKSFLNQILKGEGKEAKAFYKFLDSPAKVSSSGFNSMLEYMKYATRGHYLVIRAAKSVLDDATKMPVQEKSERDLDSFDKKMQKYDSDPESLLDVGGDIPYYMPEQSGIIGMNTARVVNYLKSKRPGIQQNSPLDTPKPPSRADKQAYMRTVQIAANPAIVFKYIKEGRLLSKDVQDLQAMYPDVYDRYVMQSIDALTEHLAKGKIIPLKVRRSLSLFGAMPLDSSLKPENIQAAQNTYQPKNEPASNQPQFAAKSSRKSEMPELTQTDQQRRTKKD